MGFFLIFLLAILFASLFYQHRDRIKANSKSRQIVVEPRSELFLVTSTPGAVAPEKEVYISPARPGKEKKSKSRTLVFIVVLFIVLGVGIGTGIGVAMTKHKSSNPEFTSTAAAASRSVIYVYIQPNRVPFKTEQQLISPPLKFLPNVGSRQPPALLP